MFNVQCGYKSFEVAGGSAQGVNPHDRARPELARTRKARIGHGLEHVQAITIIEREAENG